MIPYDVDALNEVNATYPAMDISFGPRGCSDARLQILATWQPDGPSTYMVDTDSMELTRINEINAANTRAKIAAAALYWVAPDMCDLVEQASRSIPDDSNLTPEMLPHPSGLVFFAKHLEGTHSDIDAPPEYYEKALELCAMHWYFTLRRTDKHPLRVEIDVDFYAYRHRLGFLKIGGSCWPVNDPLGSYDDASNPQQYASVIEDRRLIMSFWALLASPGVAQTTEDHPDRHTARRSQRAGIIPTATRVIYLRSISHSTGDETGLDRYHHRWIVSGHWRSQPHGPGRKLRRPVWIAPHIKGPEGAPLLGGEKVRAVIR